MTAAEFPPGRVAVIGAGPAGLMAAEVAAAAGAAVTVYDQMPSPGRKLLLAGRGGLNLTHGEDFETFLARYVTAGDHLRPALEVFGPEALRRWCADLGIDTFVGSSGRVFPASFKTSPLLRAWLRRLEDLGVRFAGRRRWLGWNAAGRLRVADGQGEAVVEAEATVLALGGATWPQLGSDGAWVPPLVEAGIAVAPLAPANCGFVVPWSDMFRERGEGEPLKSVAIDFAGRRARGDVVVTREGLEGGPIYALAGALRDALARDGTVAFHLALRPDLAAATLEGRLGRRRPKDSFSTFLRKTLNLTPTAIALLRETRAPADGPVADLDAEALARLVNAVPIRATATMPMARAISSAGGVRFDAVDPTFMLRERSGTFVAGEMLDWEAPTGGYLLQACFATGHAAGRGAAAWLGRSAAGEATPS